MGQPINPEKYETEITKCSVLIDKKKKVGEDCPRIYLVRANLYKEINMFSELLLDTSCGIDICVRLRDTRYDDIFLKLARLQAKVYSDLDEFDKSVKAWVLYLEKLNEKIDKQKGELDPELYLEKAETLLSLDRHEEILGVADQGISCCRPRHFETLNKLFLLKAREYIFQDKINDAVSTFVSLYEILKGMVIERPEFYLIRARNSKVLGDAQGAVNDTARGIHICKDINKQVQVLFELCDLEAEVYSKCMNYNAADKALKMFLQKSESTPQPHHLLLRAQTHKKLGSIKAALDETKQGIGYCGTWYSETFADLSIFQADICFLEGKDDDAMKTLNELLERVTLKIENEKKKGNKQPKLYLHRAETHMKLKFFEESVGDTQEGIRCCNPTKHFDILIELYHTQYGSYIQQEQQDKAKETLEELLKQLNYLIDEKRVRLPRLYLCRAETKKKLDYTFEDSLDDLSLGIGCCKIGDEEAFEKLNIFLLEYSLEKENYEVATNAFGEWGERHPESCVRRILEPKSTREVLSTDPRYYLLAGKLLFHKKKFDLAIQIFDKAIYVAQSKRLNDVACAALSLKNDCQTHQTAADKALKKFLQKSKSSSQPHHWLLRAQTHRKLGSIKALVDTRNWFLWNLVL